MVPKSWAQIAAYPQRPAQRPASPGPAPEADEANDTDAGRDPREDYPAIEVTAAELEAGVKFSWSTNPAHLLDHTSSSSSDCQESTPPDMENAQNQTPEAASKPAIALTPVFTVFSSDDEFDNSLTPATDGFPSDKLAQSSGSLPINDLIPATSTQTSGHFDQTVMSTDAMAKDNLVAAIKTIDLSASMMEIQSRNEPFVDHVNSTSPQASDDPFLTIKKTGLTEVKNLSKIPEATDSIQGTSAPDFHEIDLVVQSADDVHEKIPTGDYETPDSSSANHAVVAITKDEVKSPEASKNTFSQMTRTNDQFIDDAIATQDSIHVKVAQDNRTLKNADLPQSAIAAECQPESDKQTNLKAHAPPKTSNQNKVKGTETAVDFFHSPRSYPKTSVDSKGKGKEKEVYVVDDFSSNTSKNIISSNSTNNYSDKTPKQTLPAMLQPQQSAASSSCMASSSNQDVVSRLGNISYSAVPDSKSGKPHPSGLSYDERLVAIRKRVEAARDLQRAKELQLAGIDTADVIIFTNQPDSGISELRYHREVIIKESAYLSRIMPPPTDDGSPVSMYMGTWPIRMVDQVFNFMYTHHNQSCEPPSPHMFYDMAPAWANYHLFSLACAFECKRQEEYHVNNMAKMVALADKQVKGAYANYQLAYWEFSQSEEMLRGLVRTAFKETGHQEAQRPMRILVARLLALMVPWLLRGKYMGIIMPPLWFEMKEEYLPWREMLWHFRAKGEVQGDAWAWLGEPMAEEQIGTALKRYGAGF